MEVLTRKQQIVFEALKRSYAKYGKMPSVRELQKEIKNAGLVLRSPRSISLYLDALEEKGYISRTSEVRGIMLRDSLKRMFVEIPIYGAANCGAATVFADEYFQGTLKISKSILGRKSNKNIFAVQAFGTSMNSCLINGKAINDGDFVIIDNAYKPSKNNDDVPVLAVIDGLATIKIIKYMDNRRIGLFPESTDKYHKPIYLSEKDNAVINGKVVDVLKG